MAHDKQYKDTEEGFDLDRYDYPKKGETYWNRITHQWVEAPTNLTSKAPIRKERR